MKVLWFEITRPNRYMNSSAPIAGWQDSLESIIVEHDKIELYITFQATKGMLRKTIANVHYIPLIPKVSFWENKFKSHYNQYYINQKLIDELKQIVDEIKPDIIHIFGTEWGIGEIANVCKVPVVIHMMGCVAPYINALYPPNYSFINSFIRSKFNLKKLIKHVCLKHYYKTWVKAEQKNFNAVNNYMGRTAWDKAICELFHPGCKYFHCDEALRPSFISHNKLWEKPISTKISLITVGCSTHWKGMDLVLKTANILKCTGLRFSWNVIGKISKSLIEEIESNEKIKFNDVGVNFLGYIEPTELIIKLLSSNLYIHTAYIDNSPNTICEAQYLGLPIISTNVGGIPSLIEDRKEGILVPANDPYRLAYEIKELINDTTRQLIYSKESIKKAHKRHDPDSIYRDLINCYKSIINNDRC